MGIDIPGEIGYNRRMKNYTIIQMQENETARREAIAADIIAGLPDWFGNADANARFVRNAGSQAMFAAFLEEQALGFLVLRAMSFSGERWSIKNSPRLLTSQTCAARW